MDLMFKLCKKFIDEGKVPKDQLNNIAIALDCAFAIGMARVKHPLQYGDICRLLQDKFDVLGIKETITTENLLNKFARLAFGDTPFKTPGQ